MTNQNLQDVIERIEFNPDDHLIAMRVLPDGREIHLTPMTFGKSRLHITPPNQSMFYDDEWCYPSHLTGVLAMAAWDPDTEPEPVGWHRHPTSGRRRPDGDAAREYINR